MRVRIHLVALALLGLSCSRPGVIAVQEGDIVFQTSQSAQSQAIQAATHSPYSHMGMILYRNGAPYVLEARAWTRLTPYREWIHRGEGGRYVVKRLRDPALLQDPARREALRRAALAFLRRPYDEYFEWSDERVYCSELVWKAYDRSLGIQIGTLAPLTSFDLSSPAVKTKLTERYGGRVPLNELVISPAAMFASPLLEEVH